MDVCTYLFFDGNCQEAIECYRSALGAEVQHLSTFADAPEFLRPPNRNHLIFHATLKIGSTIINLSDDPSPARSDFGGFALLVHLDSNDDVDRVFEALAREGKISLVPDSTMWANRYAIVTDKFGVLWKLQHS